MYTDPSEDDTLIHDLQVLGRVVLADERQWSPGHSLPKYVTVRQADYLTRKILTGAVSGWANGVRARKAARSALMELKRQVDGKSGSDALATSFADKVIHDVEWAEHVKGAVGPGERSVA